MAQASFAAWLDSPQGCYVRAWEQSQIDALVADIFGFNALQIGFAQLDYLRQNRMPLRLACCTEAAGALRSDVHQLPFATHSIDLVLLPHVLEFDSHPHQILREVERILVPEGSVIVVGFNPFSLWGMRRALARRSDVPPWQGRYLSVARLRDWFALLGFETRSGVFGCFAPPVTQDNWLQRWGFIERLGARWWPFAGAVYAVQAIKRVHSMRLVMPKWKERMARAKALALVPQKPLAQKEDYPEHP